MGQCEVWGSMMPSRRSTKFSVRVIRWCVREILRRNGEATVVEIKSELAAKYRNCPTSYQLGQILSRSGYFEPRGMTKQNSLTSRSRVNLWGLDEAKCAEFEWYEAEVNAVEIWNEVRGKDGRPGHAHGGWDAPQRLRIIKDELSRKESQSDSETDNNTVE